LSLRSLVLEAQTAPSPAGRICRLSTCYVGALPRAKGTNNLNNQKLILITGTPSVGKTKTTETLFKIFNNSAYFDGDWGWCVNPFSLDDPRLRNGDKNISFILSNYIDLKFDYIFCSSVLFMFPDIRNKIIDGIKSSQYDLIVFHLRCSKENLSKRHYGQGLTYEPAYQWLDIDIGANDIIVDTNGKSISDVCVEIVNYINKPFILLRSENLIIRTVSEQDIDLVKKAINIDGDEVSVDEARKEIIWMNNNHEEIQNGIIKHLCLAIMNKEQNEIIGWCGIDKRKVEYINPVLYYIIKKEYWNKGYATETAKQVVNYCFKSLEIDQIDAGIDITNKASKRVLEKIGMEFNGVDSDGGFSYSLKRNEDLT